MIFSATTRLDVVSAILGVLAVPAFALTLPSSSSISHIVHEKRDSSIQRKWVPSAVDHSHILPARIGLKQSNLDLGARYLDEISNPRSSRYGKHYTVDEVTKLFAPSAVTVDVVKSWLVDSGIPKERISQSSNKAWLQFDASVGEMEELLQTKYHYYEPVNGGRKHVGCEEYKIPAALSEHIDYVTPGVKLLSTRAMGDISMKKRSLDSSPRRAISRKSILAGIHSENEQIPDATDNCGTLVTPACIKAMYNITVGKLSNPKNTLGIFESDDGYAQQDLNQFFQTYSPNIPNGTTPIPAFVDGGTTPAGQFFAGLESDLDIQTAYPIIYPQQITLYQTDSAQFTQSRDGIFNTFLDAIDGSYCTYSYGNETGDDPNIDPIYPAGQHQCGVYKPTNVISLSYGLAEDDYPFNYQTRQCNEFMKLALQGVTIVVASGDSGVSDGNTGTCQGASGKVFVPNYPDCPYLTTVGGTTLPSGSSVGDPETAATDVASGGGFSNIFAQPSYQQAAINSYFTKHNPPYKYYSSLNGTIGENDGIYNRIGRGFPDVAAVGQNGAMVYLGQNYTGGGTSMSAPIVAAIFTRINEERLASGKSTIGFVNPTLYANPQMFHDITAGDQSAGGCGTNGFSAVTGWDPVTGLGTPRYDAWLDVFMALP